MIKNIAIKRILTNTVFKGLSLINHIIPKNDSIVLLYSNMGFRDNISYIYDYMVSEGYNKKYKIIRSQNEKYTESIPQNVKVESNARSIITYLRAGHIFYCFGKLPIYPTKNQRVVQMWHGAPFKGTDIRQMSEMTGDYKKSFYTDVLSMSELFRDFWAVEFDCGKGRISICGQPRTDVMINPYSKEELGLSEQKMIIWMPTFRNSSKLGYSDVKNISSFLPVISIDELDKLNECLRDNSVHLIVKLHPMQDDGNVRQTKYSNLIIYRHDDFQKTGYDLYRLLGSSDALITDYSSVFMDYMLLNRPIAFTEDDIEDYRDTRGFAVDNPDHYRTGNKITTFIDMRKFIEEIAKGIDEWAGEREQVNEEVNTYRDFCNRRRALEIGGVKL